MVLHRVKSHAHLRDHSKQCLQRVDEQCLHGHDEQQHVESARPNEITTSLGKGRKESDDPIYNDDTISTKERQASSSREPVPTTEEGNTAGTAKSELHNVGSLFSEFDPGSLPSPLSPPDLTSNDCAPSDSLLMLASLYIPSLEDGKSATPSRSDSVVQQSKSNQSWQSWHDWFVTLFAGRKVTSVKRKNRNETTSLIGNPIPEQPAPQLPQIESTPRPLHVAACPQPRRLLHCDVIPPVLLPRLDHAFRRSSYKQILPAPMTAFTGYAVVTEDEWYPEIILHGFDEPEITLRPSLAQNYTNLPARLLDRDGDKWARYRMEHLMPGSNRALSGDVGEQYPFTHGHCWQSPGNNPEKTRRFIHSVNKKKKLRYHIDRFCIQTRR